MTPNQWKNELEKAYLDVVIMGTRGSAEKRAVEATAWMKENAPWKDRSPEERQRQDGYAHKGAREYLKCEVVTDKVEEAANEALKSQAKRQDRKALSALNIKRKAAGQIKMSRLPKSQSALGAVEKEIAATRIPLVDLKFSQTSRLRYTIWLEIGMGGRFSIIAPAISHWGKKLMNDVKRIANLQQFSITMGESTMPQISVASPFTPAKAAQRARNRKYYDPEKAAAKYRERGSSGLDIEAERRLDEYDRKYRSGKR